jgi:UDP-N-acetylmuramate-alanine ligase
MPAVPRPQSTLSDAERNELDRWVAELEQADQQRKDVRAGFAAWVRSVGPAAVAHELGITRGAINERLKSYEGTYRRRGIKHKP